MPYAAGQLRFANDGAGAARTWLRFINPGFKVDLIHQAIEPSLIMPADLTPEGKAEAEQLLGGLGISPNVLTYVYLPQTLLDPCRASDACLSFVRIHFM